jgi:hypothetical protein
VLGLPAQPVPPLAPALLCLLIDFTATRSATTAALGCLKHAAYACHRHHVGLHVVGAGRLAAELPALACHHLTRIDGFPTLEAAQQSLEPPGEIVRSRHDVRARTASANASN